VNFADEVSTPQGSLHCHKSLRRGTGGFMYLPMDIVLRILIALNNPSSLLSLSLIILGLVASTITNRPPRVTNLYLSTYLNLILCHLKKKT
jgi:hypothetical protein